MPPIPTPLGWLRETQRLSDASIEKAITEDMDVTLDDTAGTATVTNHSGDEATEYTVGYGGEIVSTCDCPHYTYRDVICKHMVRVAVALEDREVEA